MKITPMVFRSEIKAQGLPISRNTWSMVLLCES
jgi:hypothetical protein